MSPQLLQARLQPAGCETLVRNLRGLQLVERAGAAHDRAGGEPRARHEDHHRAVLEEHCEERGVRGRNYLEEDLEEEL